ncbi:hypothetical protein U0070_011755 [Myodes glareolus]|uniref:Uncharacterized protein n=1 Tax=Myodes glareolus TaxID=447135 RepID=A0AAW0H3Y5_MYOGA
MMTNERNELRTILANYTNNDVNNSASEGKDTDEGKVGMLREDNRKLQQEQIYLQESCEETKRLCEEDLQKVEHLQHELELTTAQEESLLQMELRQAGAYVPSKRATTELHSHQPRDSRRQVPLSPAHLDFLSTVTRTFRLSHAGLS